MCSPPPDTIAHFAPAAKLVLKVLEYEGATDRQTLLKETRLPERTLDRAVADLEAAGIVSCETDLRDQRRVVCHIGDKTEVEV